MTKTTFTTTHETSQRRPRNRGRHHPGIRERNQPGIGGRLRRNKHCVRDELLNETLFFTLGQARVILARWSHDYNTERPHSSLSYAAPAAFAAGLEKQRAGLTPPVASPAQMRNNTDRSMIAAG